MLDKLKKHHIGIVVAPERVAELEKRIGKNFHDDKTQGVRVCFQWNEYLGLYEEYFTAEGRACKYPLGYHHVCYDVDSMDRMKEIDAFFRAAKLGFRLTFPEPSGSKECGLVSFYKMRGIGMVEFNILSPEKDSV